MTYRVVITPVADAEAMAAFRWYAERSLTAARRWYAGLARAIQNLSNNPERYPVSEDDSDALQRQVRMLLYGRRRGIYRILYTVIDDTVYVLRIRHSAQGPIEP